MTNLNELFIQAQNEVNGLDERPNNAELLKLYGLFKQATAGDNSAKRPSMLDVKGRAKYDAWYGYNGMDPVNAKKAYIEVVNLLQKSQS